MWMLIALFSALLQIPVSNATYGYRFTLPEGFVDYPEGKDASPKTIDCWAEEAADSSASTLVLCTQHLGLTMGTDTLEAKDVPTNTQRSRYKWKEFDLQGFLQHVTRDDGEIFALTVQVPLKNEAVQLTFAGAPGDEARADSLMRMTLASLEGESNWLTRSQRMEKLGEVLGYWISAAIGIPFLFWIYRRRKAAEARAARKPAARPTRPPQSGAPKPPGAPTKRP